MLAGNALCGVRSAFNVSHVFENLELLPIEPTCVNFMVSDTHYILNHAMKLDMVVKCLALRRRLLLKDEIHFLRTTQINFQES